MSIEIPAGRFSAQRAEVRPLQVQLVDLNNFTSFPTLAIGILVASLRGAGHRVRVLCPLEHGIPSSVRERRETRLHDLQRRVHLSTAPAFRAGRDAAHAVRAAWRDRPDGRVLAHVREALAEGPDLLLLSAYLQHYPTVVEIGRLAQAAGIPLLLGGPMFNLRQTAHAWLGVPGLAAIYGGEADRTLADLVAAIAAGAPLHTFPGVLTPEGLDTGTAPPLRELDRVPVPDFTDFPWARYPTRIVPLMASRGCQWGKCLFCSDVVSASGRSFRSRGAEGVLAEMAEQARRHDTRNFLFLDLKLNSNPHLLRGIVEGVQDQVPGAEWIGTVHVDTRRDNGLSADELRAAVRAGMRRVSFGLETGSQRLLDLMQKGSTVERNGAFIRDAHAAGLSIRATMFQGFPGETAADMEATADFLEAHAPFLDRVRFNAFALMQDTPIFDRLREEPRVAVDHRRAVARFRSGAGPARAYRREKARALAVVHAINRRELRLGARQFDGLM